MEFYNRINSLISPSMQVLDFGAGRAAWDKDGSCEFKKMLRSLQGKVAKVVGCDVDTAVFENKTLDECAIIEIGKPLPFENCSFDLIVSDFTFEHIDNPDEVAAEMHRILKPGGWICSRTPNKYSYIALLARMIKNSSHEKVLSRAQPARKAMDVFPTVYKLNSIRDVSRHFVKSKFDNFTYRFEPEPAYHFNSKFVFGSMLLLNRILPPFLKSNLFIFLQKK